MEILAIVPIILIAAFILGEMFKRIGLPSVVGQILAGLMFGIPVLKELLFQRRLNTSCNRFSGYTWNTASSLSGRIRD